MHRVDASALISNRSEPTFIAWYDDLALRQGDLRAVAAVRGSILGDMTALDLSGVLP
jgi:hypothetical protein